MLDWDLAGPGSRLWDVGGRRRMLGHAERRRPRSAVPGTLRLSDNDGRPHAAPRPLGLVPLEVAAIAWHALLLAGVALGVVDVGSRRTAVAGRRARPRHRRLVMRAVLAERHERSVRRRRAAWGGPAERREQRAPLAAAVVIATLQPHVAPLAVIARCCGAYPRRVAGDRRTPPTQRRRAPAALCTTRVSGRRTAVTESRRAPWCASPDGR